MRAVHFSRRERRRFRRPNAFGHQDEPAHPRGGGISRRWARRARRSPARCRAAACARLHADYPVQSASNAAVGRSGVPVVDLLGRHLDDPDRLDIGSPIARMGLLDRCSLSGRSAPDIDDLVRHLSAEGSLAEQCRRISRRRQRADRQRHLGSRVCVCMVSNICCSSVDGQDSGRAFTNSCAIIPKVIAIRQSCSRRRRNRAEAKERRWRTFGRRPREGARRRLDFSMI